MNKERVKNLVLVFLIAMNFILGSRILFERKLWPSGYNFFSNANNFEITSILQGIKNHFTDSKIYKSSAVGSSLKQKFAPADSVYQQFRSLAEKTFRMRFKSYSTHLSTVVISHFAGRFDNFTVTEMYSVKNADSENERKTIRMIFLPVKIKHCF